MARELKRIRYFEDIGLKPEQYIMWFEKEKPKKSVKKATKENGVDPRECYNLDESFIYWLYPRLCCFIEDASGVIDLDYHLITYNGESRTLKLWLNYIKDRFDAYLKFYDDKQNENSVLYKWDATKEEKAKYFEIERDVHRGVNDAVHVFAEILFYLWW